MVSIASSTIVPKTIIKRITAQLSTVSLAINKAIYPGPRNTQSGNDKSKASNRLISVSHPNSRSRPPILNQYI